MYASAAKVALAPLLTSKLLFGFNFVIHFTPVMSYISSAVSGRFGFLVHHYSLTPDTLNANLLSNTPLTYSGVTRVNVTRRGN